MNAGRRGWSKGEPWTDNQINEWPSMSRVNPIWKAKGNTGNFS